MKTEEGKEREEAIKAMAGVVGIGLTEAARDWIGQLYDADYRKVKELSDEEIEFYYSCRPGLEEDNRQRYISGAKRARDYILGKDNG